MISLGEPIHEIHQQTNGTSLALISFFPSSLASFKFARTRVVYVLPCRLLPYRYSRISGCSSEQSHHQNLCIATRQPASLGRPHQVSNYPLQANFQYYVCIPSHAISGRNICPAQLYLRVILHLQRVAASWLHKNRPSRIEIHYSGPSALTIRRPRVPALLRSIIHAMKLLSLCHSREGINF